MDSDFCVRVTDHALAKDLFPDDYQILHGDEILPLKWMPIEILERDKKVSYGVWSDIWSFGILLWELSTLASSPFMVRFYQLYNRLMN